MPNESIPKYLPAVLSAAAEVELPAGRVTEVTVCHDDGCDVWEGRPCNCDPEVFVHPDRP
jgi:hypothetical protein